LVQFPFFYLEPKMTARRVAYTTAHKITNWGGVTTVKQRIAVLLMLGIVPWAGLHAEEQTATTTFKVTARVQAACEVIASDLSIGTSTTLLRTTCTPNSTYNVGLNTVPTNTVWGAGTGLAQDYTVFGGVPAAQVVPAGAYADAITVRVYY
jgi:spore coat protein U-like protein